MQQTNTQLPEIKLVGITARTSNSAEMNPETAQIGATINKYFSQGIPQRVINQVGNGKTYCVYTEYENGIFGQYTYFIGQEVTSFEGIADDLFKLTIPAQNYAKFTSDSGQMPDVCIDVWQNIWKMDALGFGGERTYIADFELYDERAYDPQNTVLDVFIGIKK